VTTPTNTGPGATPALHRPARGVRAAFTDRRGGVSPAPYDALNLGPGVGDDSEAVTANRRRTAASLGLDPGDVAWMSQVHGAEVAEVHAGGNAGRVDAMATTRTGVALAVLVADCLPVLVADPEAGVIGAAHSGRPGTARNIAGELVRAMERLGATARNCVALLGPAVCGTCYEVPDDLQQEVALTAPEGACRTGRGTSGVDIRAAVSAQLTRAGVGELHHDARCTMETPELYSYRRDGRTGRFAAYLWRSEP
jgi:polyphenol oxidase